MPGVGGRAEGALRSPRTSLEEVVVPLLVNELIELPGRVVLVLDDLHSVADEEIHRSLVAFVERLPATVHLAVATRADPPWPMLPRLRARDQLVELRSGQMRFSEAEAGSYLAALGLELTADRVAEIQQRTEGWAAGVQLAGLSLRAYPASEDFVGALAGDSQEIGDYLASEVLDRVAPQERRFLLQTSILDRMSGALCDAVICADGSAAQLADLDRRNLFVVALDSRRRWYRYHPLFGELLRSRLDAEQPGTAVELHGRAATWLAREGQIAEAIGHAVAAGDQHATADLVAGHWLALLNQGWLMTVGALAGRSAARAAGGRAAAVAGAGLEPHGPRRARRRSRRGSRPRRRATSGSASCAPFACSSSATSAAPRVRQAPPWRPTTPRIRSGAPLPPLSRAGPHPGKRHQLLRGPVGDAVLSGPRGQDTNRPFPWVVSDFGLIDAIESGLVKIPQLAVRDTTGADIPGYFNIWHWILPKLTPAERGGKGESEARSDPEVRAHPIAMLAGLWEDLREEWEGRRRRSPPAGLHPRLQEHDDREGDLRVAGGTNSLPGFRPRRSTASATATAA